MINCEGFGRNRSCSNRSTFPAYSERYLQRLRKSSRAGIADKIRVGDASPKHKIIIAPQHQPTKTGLSIKYIYVNINLITLHKLQGYAVSCETVRC
jgi:hypothetical protein